MNKSDKEKDKHNSQTWVKGANSFFEHLSSREELHSGKSSRNYDLVGLYIRNDIVEYKVEHYMFKAKDIHKRYKKVRAVNGVSLEADDGEVVGIVGPNGAGKTTFLRCVSGFVEYDSGNVSLNKKDLIKDMKEFKSMIAFVEEIPSPVPYLTVWEQISFTARLFGMTEWEKDAERLIRDFDLIEKKDELTSGLSKGMKQKLMITCAFVHKPHLIFLDEPLIGIDPKGAKTLKRLINEQRSRKGIVIISSHMLDLVERVCDRVVIMNNGRKITEGTIDSIKKMAGKSNTEFEDAFIKITSG